MSDECVHTYTLQVWGPGPIVGYERDESGAYQQYHGLAPSLVEEAMEHITDLLPQGYTADIQAWDEGERT